MSRYTTTVDNNNISLTIDKQEHTLSLSRTGGQGSKGDSVSNVVIDSNSDLIITIVKADGTTYDINAGNLESTIDLGDLADFEIVNEQQGDLLVYDSTAGKFKNHQLTTSRVLQHYNASTMTRRTKNINIVSEDLLLVHPKDAEKRDLNTGDIGRLYSGRGEVALKVEVTDKVKEGIVFTTFHFPEHMVNMVTGHGKDEETMCAEYKVSSVEVQKISNQFKTEVKPKENQAEVS